MNKVRFLVGCQVIAGWLALTGMVAAQSEAGAIQAVNSGATTSLSDWTEPAASQPISGQSYFGSSGCQCGSCSGDCRNGDVWATITPYFWLPAIKGQLGVGPVLLDVDLSLSDTWDLLSDLKGAAMVHLEVGRGDRGLIVDTLIADFSTSETLPSGGIGTAETSMTFFEGLGFRRISSQDRGGRIVRGVSWDVLYGVRYYQVGMQLGVIPPSGPSVSVERSGNWVDLVMGTRTSMKLANGGTAFARADFGGFGLGSSSDLAWNLQLGMENRLRRHPNTSSILGYRILDIDRSKGSGVGSSLFDINMQGPFAALMFRF